MGKAKLLGGEGFSIKNGQVIEGYALNNQISLGNFVTKKGREAINFESSDAYIAAAKMIDSSCGLLIMLTKDLSMSAGIFKGNIIARPFKIIQEDFPNILLGTEKIIAKDIYFYHNTNTYINLEQDNRISFVIPLYESLTYYTLKASTFYITVDVNSLTCLASSHLQAKDIFEKVGSYKKFFEHSSGMLYLVTEYYDSDYSRHYLRFYPLVRSDNSSAYDYTTGQLKELDDLNFSYINDIQMIDDDILCVFSNYSSYYMTTIKLSNNSVTRLHQSKAVNCSDSLSRPILYNKKTKKIYVAGTYSIFYEYTLIDSYDFDTTINKLKTSQHYETYSSFYHNGDLYLLYLENSSAGFPNQIQIGTIATQGSSFAVNSIVAINNVYKDLIKTEDVLLLTNLSSSSATQKIQYLWTESWDRLNNTYTIYDGTSAVSGVSLSKLLFNKKGKISTPYAVDSLSAYNIPRALVANIIDDSIDEVKGEVTNGINS